MPEVLAVFGSLEQISDEDFGHCRGLFSKTGSTRHSRAGALSCLVRVAQELQDSRIHAVARVLKLNIYALYDHLLSVETSSNLSGARRFGAWSVPYKHKCCS
jgi:hypothetical protein